MALLKQYRDFKAKEEELNHVQLYLREYFSQFNDLVFLNGRLISGIQCSTTITSVEHKLGRQPLGWFIVDKNDIGDVWRESWDDKTIVLDSSATVTVSIWIF